MWKLLAVSGYSGSYTRSYRLMLYFVPVVTVVISLYGVGRARDVARCALCRMGIKLDALGAWGRFWEGIREW